MEWRRSSDYKRLGWSRCWWLLPLFLLGSGGCSLVAETSLHRQTSAPPAVKRAIYREVAASIADNRRQGDNFLRRGDLHRALARYRQAAFYEQTPELVRKIAELETRIAKESKRLVAEAETLLANDEEAALKTFNRALRINPGHEDAHRGREQLMAKPRFQAELTGREAALRQTWASYAAQPGDITTLTQQANAVLEYEFDHSLALKIEDRLDRQRRNEVRIHLEQGLNSYQAGELEQAKFFAQKARAIDPDNQEVISFLEEIRKDQDNTYYLNLARYRVEQGDFDKAEEYAEKALALDPDQQAAATIIQKVQLERLKDSLAQAGACFAHGDYEEAIVHLQRVLAGGPRCREWPELQESVRKLLNREIPTMIDQAQKLFAENKLRQANHILVCVLHLDPENGMAATYHKKIQSRLDTIKSLQ